jgi:hypothetical protein
MPVFYDKDKMQPISKVLILNFALLLMGIGAGILLALTLQEGLELQMKRFIREPSF